MENKDITGIILASGNSMRYGKGINKNFEMIGDKKVIEHSLQVFCDNKKISNIIITIKEEDKKELEKILSKKEYSKKIQIVIGGRERMDSAQNAVKEAKRK